MVASSSSSASICRWNYDVFLSFRGDDTRGGFMDHLFKSLKWQGIETFRDDKEIHQGMNIPLELLRAIETSKIAIVILSKNYASSTWCLEELVKILHCREELGMVVLPVFYGVEPSDLRKQNGIAAQALARHEAKFGVNNFKLRSWMDALWQVSNIKGLISDDWLESELIEDISKRIWNIIQQTWTSSREEHLIGVGSKVEQLAPLLEVESGGVVLVGIWGMGGVGKTTIARAVYDRFRICQKFEVCIFLSNVREKSQGHGLPSIQNELLSRILMKNNNDIWDSHEGSVKIEKVLRHKKLLLVLDDVDQLDQLNGLITNQDSLGSGSRVIITTRDANLLITFGIERRNKVHELEAFEALQLLCLNAFDKPYPKEGYLDLSKRIVRLLGGLPLALEVLGSSLRNRNIIIWKSAIAELEGGVHERIFKALKISYDGLDEKEKAIFLDVACFFKGKKRELVVEILDGCGLGATMRVDQLVQKSLLTVSDNGRLMMHDLLQEMGKEIVAQKSFQDFLKGSRLWCPKDTITILTKNMCQETESIHSIFLKSKAEITTSNPEVFLMMHRLKLLNICNVKLPNGLKGLPNELRYLKWSRCPLRLLPMSYEGNELIQLHMCHSNLERFWMGKKHLEKVKYIKLSHSRRLLKTPASEEIPNLKKLDLSGCTSLVEIHSSIFVSEKLTILNLKDCKNIRLPSRIELKVLKILILSRCSKIKEIPEFVGNTKRLLELYLDGTSIIELPLSLVNLSGLTLLNLRNCKNLVWIDPKIISMLKSLQNLDFFGCSKLGNQLEEMTKKEHFEEIDVRGTAIREARPPFVVQGYSKATLGRGFRWLVSRFCVDVSPRSVGVSSVFGLNSLQFLDLSDCNLGSFPDGIDSLSSLKELVLCDNDFSYLPTSISRLSNLRRLHVERCRRLLSLPELPPQAFRVYSKGCISLKNIQNISPKCIPNITLENILGNSKSLDHLATQVDYFSNCYQMEEKIAACTLLMRFIQEFVIRRATFSIIIPGNAMPEGFAETKAGSSISINLGPYSHNVESVSFATCVVFGPIELAGEDIKMDYESRFIINMDCRLTPVHASEDCRSKSMSFYVSDCLMLVSDRIWLHYWRPTHVLQENHVTDCIEIELKFELLVPCRSVLELKKCGVRLILAREMEELRQTMDQYSHGNSSGIVHERVAGVNEIHSEASGSCNSEIHSERLACHLLKLNQL